MSRRRAAWAYPSLAGGRARRVVSFRALWFGLRLQLTCVVSLLAILLAVVHCYSLLLPAAELPESSLRPLVWPMRLVLSTEAMAISAAVTYYLKPSPQQRNCPARVLDRQTAGLAG